MFRKVKAPHVFKGGPRSTSVWNLGGRIITRWGIYFRNLLWTHRWQTLWFRQRLPHRQAAWNLEEERTQHHPFIGIKLKLTCINLIVKKIYSSIIRNQEANVSISETLKSVDPEASSGPGSGWHLSRPLRSCWTLSSISWLRIMARLLVASWCSLFFGWLTYDP